MKKTKIIIATPLYPPDIGGPATYAQILKNDLPEVDFSVSVLSFGSVRRLPKIVSHFVYTLKLLKNARSTDVILALDPISVGLPACLAASILRKKFILRVAGDRAWEAYNSRKSKVESRKFVDPEEFQKKSYGIMTALRRRVQKGVAKKAMKVIVPSEYLKSIVIMWGIEKEKIYVVYNSFDKDEFTLSNKTELRSLLGIDGKAIISASRMVPWKGFSALIEIMPDIIKKIPDSKLYIAGDGPELNNLQQTTSKLKLERSIIFLGALPHATLMQYVKASDVFVLNTGYEGLSHHIIEAMNVGVPVVTTDVGGNPELIENGKEGILLSYNNKAELENAIIETLNGHIDSERLVENAKKKVSEFSKERMLKETIKILS